jgi:hypothetical protein
MLKNDRFPISNFWTNGFAIAKGVFTDAEIEQLRSSAYETASYTGDLLSNPKLGWLVYDQRLLDIAKAVLGKPLVYFGDSNCLLGKESHGWHKDNADRDDPNAPDWKSRYTVIRMGIYLQDHARHSGGLNVRTGSHNILDIRGGKNAYLATSVGDVVLWSLRTSHSGTGKLLRVIPQLEFEPAIADRLPNFLFRPMDRDRVALFISYGLNDEAEHLSRYIAYLKTRKYMISSWSNSCYSREVLKWAEENELIINDVWSEIKHESGLGANELHAPISY